MGGTNSITTWGPYLNGLWLAVVSRCSIEPRLRMGNTALWFLSSAAVASALSFLSIAAHSFIYHHPIYLWAVFSLSLFSSQVFSKWKVLRNPKGVAGLVGGHLRASPTYINAIRVYKYYIRLVLRWGILALSQSMWALYSLQHVYKL